MLEYKIVLKKVIVIKKVTLLYLISCYLRVTSSINELVLNFFFNIKIV